MSLTIGKHQPENIAKIDNILKSQYIITTEDMNEFLLAQADMKGFVEFEGDTFIFEEINVNIRRKTINESTITITHSKLDINNLLNILEEQNDTNWVFDLFNVRY